VARPAPNLGSLLRWAYRAFETEVLERLHRSGYPDVRLPHVALLAWMDDEGTRQATLIERTGLTAQAVSQLIEDLVSRGYLARQPAREDRRAKLIVWTERGRDARDVARRLVGDIERGLAERLGARRYDTMRRGLAEVAAAAPRPTEPVAPPPG
jgi:DNA-binding MarR family transcriptional regulator